MSRQSRWKSRDRLIFFPSEETEVKRWIDWCAPVRADQRGMYMGILLRTTTWVGAPSSLGPSAGALFARPVGRPWRGAGPGRRRARAGEVGAPSSSFPNASSVAPAPPSLSLSTSSQILNYTLVTFSPCTSNPRLDSSEAAAAAAVAVPLSR